MKEPVWNAEADFKLVFRKHNLRIPTEGLIAELSGSWTPDSFDEFLTRIGKDFPLKSLYYAAIQRELGCQHSLDTRCGKCEWYTEPTEGFLPPLDGVLGRPRDSEESP